jgi:hypothetical protein
MEWALRRHRNAQAGVTERQEAMEQTWFGNPTHPRAPLPRDRHGFPCVRARLVLAKPVIRDEHG